MITKEINIVQANPGAVTVISRLQWYSNYPKYLDYLIQNGITGPDLWVLYKDVHKEDIDSLAKDLEQRLHAWRGGEL